jgi:hypothetical protein
MKTIFKSLLVVALLCSAIPVINAQFIVKNTGRCEMGTCDGLDTTLVTPNELDSITSLAIYGSGNMGINGRISFGDHFALGAMNVFIGERMGSDNDQLWLHGKKGFYYTSGPHAQDTVFYYDNNLGNYFQFNCDMRTTGVFIASDSSFKENINPVEGVLSSIDSISAVTYNLKPEFGGIGGNKVRMAASNGGTPKEQQDAEFFSKFYNSLKDDTPRYGFIAQDLKKVYPQLVHSDKTGRLYVDYIGLVPILVEAVKELKAEVTVLKSAESAEPQKAQQVNSNSGTSQIEDELAKPALYQNAPNPFNAATVIKYILPQSVGQAAIYIYDMQGKQVKRLDVTERGKSSVTIQAADLAAGMYIYALIADGQEIASKRMILTK